MKCDYCQDPIHRYQEYKTRPNRDGKDKHYHKGCYGFLLDKVIETRNSLVIKSEEAQVTFIGEKEWIY